MGQKNIPMIVIWMRWHSPPLQIYRIWNSSPGGLRPFRKLDQDNLLRMRVPYCHSIWNSSAGLLRPSTLPLGHRGSPQYCVFTSERRRNILFLWHPRSPSFQAGSFYLYTRASVYGKHSTLQHLLDECCIFPYRTQMNIVFMSLVFKTV